MRGLFLLTGAEPQTNGWKAASCMEDRYINTGADLCARI